MLRWRRTLAPLLPLVVSRSLLHSPRPNLQQIKRCVALKQAWLDCVSVCDLHSWQFFQQFWQITLDPWDCFWQLITHCPSCHPKIGSPTDPERGRPQACDEDLHHWWQRCNSTPLPSPLRVFLFRLHMSGVAKAMALQLAALISNIKQRQKSNNMTGHRRKQQQQSSILIYHISVNEQCQ